MSRSLTNPSMFGVFRLQPGYVRHYHFSAQMVSAGLISVGTDLGKWGQNVRGVTS